MLINNRKQINKWKVLDSCNLVNERRELDVFSSRCWRQDIDKESQVNVKRKCKQMVMPDDGHSIDGKDIWRVWN